MKIVNHQVFFDNFALFTNVPNSVIKLREIILQLAIEGRLVDQDSSNEPASRLVEKIDVAREALLMGHERRKNLILSSVNVEDVPFALPSNWLWTRLGHLSQIIEYGTSEKASLDQKGIPVFRMNNINGGTIESSNLKYVCASIKDLPRLYLKTNDLLFNRTNSFQLVGKTGIFKGASDKFTFASYLIRIRLFDSYVSPDYVNWAMNADYFRTTQINPEVTQQCGQANFNGTKLANVLIPLPPLIEQKRIVAKVDELMRLCDELEKCEERKRKSRAFLNDSTLAPLNHAASLTPERFKQASVGLADNFTTLYDSVETVGKLRSTILQLGVQGKLAEQHPDDETILIKGESPDARDILFQSPRNWVWARFGEIAEIVSGVTKGRKLHGRKTTVYPYLRVANVQRWFLDLRVMKEIEILEDEIEKYRLKKNDLLITEGGDWDKVGRTAIWNDEIENCVHQNHVFRARLLRSDISPIWVMTFVNSVTGRTYFESASKQTTNLASISMRQLRACPIAVPPLAEQKRIVAKVSQLMSLCDELETKLRQSEADSEKLMNAAAKYVLQAVTEAGGSNGLRNAPSR